MTEIEDRLLALEDRKRTYDPIDATTSRSTLIGQDSTPRNRHSSTPRDRRFITRQDSSVIEPDSLIRQLVTALGKGHVIAMREVSKLHLVIP
jgi:hypothetical protein